MVLDGDAANLIDMKAGIRDFWLVLNKIGSAQVEAVLMDKLGRLRERVLGVLSYDQDLIMAGLSGGALGDCAASRDVERILDTLEQRLSSDAKP